MDVDRIPRGTSRETYGDDSAHTQREAGLDIQTGPRDIGYIGKCAVQRHCMPVLAAKATVLSTASPISRRSLKTAPCASFPAPHPRASCSRS